ncbi:GNAT family N-acetyltransferase [Actinomadura rugatobispora]|uniref:GNAT family N-acetyltransferase n=1 Tax=Actinomadura rugatobispora TaxID=1994 RepID=A0ABW1AGE1_9ACTN|nr:GNAT family N-acetyltransferase [Actinomadura rugatobispora]
MLDVLRTGRLVLHPVGTGDHRALLRHWTGPRVRRHLFDDRILCAEQVTEIIEASLHDFATEGYGLWALRFAPPDTGPDALDPFALLDPVPGAPLAGVVGLRRMEGPGHGLDVEIVYSLEPEHWGRGLAAEAARAVLDHAFEVLALPRVIAEIDEGNAASAEVAEHLGMRPYAGAFEGASDGLTRYVAERAGTPETVEA